MPRVSMGCKPALLLLLFLHHTVRATAGAQTRTAMVACKSSVYPKLCRAVLSPLRFPSDPYEYGRFSVKQAMKQARRTTLLLDRYLARDEVGGAGIGRGALEDCMQLAELNWGYLEAVKGVLGGGGGEYVVSAEDVDRVRALMSALVTNQQTCFDGLEASRAYPELFGIVTNQTRLYGVSLELVTSALEQRGRRQPGSQKPASESESEPHTPTPTPTPAPYGFGFQHTAGFPAIGGDLLEEVGDNINVGLVNQSVTVAKDGTGNFTSVGEAVAFAPNYTSVDDGYFAILISEGVYEENVLVPKNKKNLMLVGAGMNRTVITGNRSWVDGWSTFNSATFAVHGERFIARDITFENTAGPEKHQAVAVRNSADLSTFYRCSFLGYQDTLYVHSLRQFYRDCDIYGTVDFVFGNAAVVLQNCNLYARRPLLNQFNTITAQGRTHLNQTTGISIHNCTVRAAPGLESELINSTTKTFLGRPWKEYSRTVYMQSFMDRVVEPVGWSEWNGSFALSTLYYGEYENYGAGANTSGRVQWPGHILMNATDAFYFTVYNFTTGGAWLPSTSVPHDDGLL